MASNFQNIKDSSNSNHFVGVIGSSEMCNYDKKFGVSSCHISGENGAVFLGHSEDFDLEFNNFTLEFWWNKTNVGDAFLLTRRGNEENPNNWCEIKHDVMGIVKVRIGNGTGGLYFQTTIVSNNEWNHFALVRNGDNFVLYINGREKDKAVSGNSILLSGGNGLIFGNSEYDENKPFAGYFDEVRLVNTATWVSDFTPPTRSYPNYYHWSFENNLDEKNNNLFSSWLLNEISLTHSDMIVGNHLLGDKLFVGDNFIYNDNFVDFPTSGNPYSISCMFKLNSLPTDEWTEIWAFNSSIDASGSILSLRLDRDTQQISHLLNHNGVNNKATSSMIIQVGQWYHSLCVYTGTEIKLFINGIGEVTALPYATEYSKLDQFVVGKSYYRRSIPYYFTGEVKELYMWNTELDINDSQKLFNGGMGIEINHKESFGQVDLDNFMPNLVSYYSMNDEGYGITDYMFRNQGKQNGTVEFYANGVNKDCVNFVGNGYFNCGKVFNKISSFTISAWIKINDGTNLRRLVTQGSSTVLDSVNPYLSIYVDSNNNLTGEIGGNSTSFSVQYDGFTFNSWLNVMLSYDGALLNLYVNGNLVDTSPAEEVFGVNLLSDMVIGSDYSENGWENVVDEFYIWNTSLSIDAIEAHWNLGNGKFLDGDYGGYNANSIIIKEKKAITTDFKQIEQIVSLVESTPAVGNLVVVGAGDMDGHYIPSGEYNGKLKYNLEGDKYIWWDNKWGGHWFISTELYGLPQECNFYVNSSEKIPPLNGWHSNGGLKSNLFIRIS